MGRKRRSNTVSVSTKEGRKEGRKERGRKLVAKESPLSWKSPVREADV